MVGCLLVHKSIPIAPLCFVGMLSFSWMIYFHRPTSHKISPLGARDILPSGIQVFQLVLSYMFHLVSIILCNGQMFLLTRIYRIALIFRGSLIS